jgi:two-component system nitrate/nitrite sensor histidine kinase NarX
MSVTSLRWAAVALPVAFVLFLRVTTEGLFQDVLASWQSLAIFFGLLSFGCFLFATVIFGWVDRSQQASEARARELQALNDLGGRLTGASNDDAILTLTLEAARGLLPARAVGIALHRDGVRSWRAVGERTDDLELSVQREDEPPPATPRIVGDDGSAAVVVSSPLNTAGRLYALFDADQAGSLTSLSRLMDGLARHATAALDRCELFEDVQRREQRTRALYDVGLEIVSSQDLSRVLQQVTAHACRLVEARAAALCLVSESDHSLSLAQTAGDAAAIFTPAVHDDGRIELADRAVLVGGVAPACGFRLAESGYHCIRSHLIVGNAVVGELCVAHEGDHPFTDDERALLAGLADMAAIAIHNSRLRDRERQVAILEERDHLAREMHDTLAQILGYLHLKAATTRKRLQAGEVARATDEVQ